MKESDLSREQREALGAVAKDMIGDNEVTEFSGGEICIEAAKGALCPVHTNALLQHDIVISATGSTSEDKIRLYVDTIKREEVEVTETKTLLKVPETWRDASEVLQ